ncbi:hypothetical protein THAOC_27585, partial [Thalassiosira oceanica]
MDYYKQISADRAATTEAQQQASADPNPAEEYPLPLKKKDAFESEKAAAGEAPSRAAAGRRRTRKKSSEGDSHDETASTADTRGSESTDPQSRREPGRQPVEQDGTVAEPRVGVVEPGREG